VFVWTLMTYLHAEPHKHVVVHCTHGYNRTGAPPPLPGLLAFSASHNHAAVPQGLLCGAAGRLHAGQLHGAPWAVGRGRAASLRKAPAARHLQGALHRGAVQIQS